MKKHSDRTGKYRDGQEVAAPHSKITPADINRLNRKAWAQWSAEFEATMKKRPTDAQIAVEIVARRNTALVAEFGPKAAERAFRATESMEQTVADLEKSHTEDMAARRKKANDKRQNEAREKALTAYRDWEKRLSSTLEGKSTSERVAAYLLTKELTDRQKRRIRALLKAGDI